MAVNIESMTPSAKILNRGGAWEAGERVISSRSEGRYKRWFLQKLSCTESGEWASGKS